jgi:hypothetical protein
VFLKPALPAYASILRRFDADGTFMFEEANQARLGFQDLGVWFLTSGFRFRGEVANQARRERVEGLRLRVSGFWV